MPGSSIAQSAELFLLAGLCEIAGGWLVWQWFKESRPWPWGLPGGLILFIYGRYSHFSAGSFWTRLCGLRGNFHDQVLVVAMVPGR